MKDVIIIGAGIAGLSAAYEFHKDGTDFQILEPENKPGGVIETLEVDGNLVETGPYTFSSYSKEFLGLVKSLGIEKELQEADPSSKKRYIYLNNYLVPVPENLQQFFKSELLTKDSKWTLLEEFILPRVQKEESVEDFISRRFGREVLKNIVQPFLNGVFAGDVKKLSADAVFPKIKEIENKYKSVIFGSFINKLGQIFKGKKPLTLYSFKEGMQYLPNKLYETMKNKITLSAGNIEISRAKDFFIVTFKANNKTINYTTNSILFAIPAHKMKEYGYLIPDEYLADFSKIDYAPISTIAQVIDKSKLKFDLDGFGFLCTKEVHKKLLGTIWTSSIFPNRISKDKVLLNSFIGGAHFRKVAEMSNEEVAALTAKELAEVLQMPDAESIKTINVKTYEHAIPQYNMGHLNTVKRIEKLMDSKYGVFFTGNYLRGISINDTVKTSIKTADKIKKFLKTVVKKELASVN